MSLPGSATLAAIFVYPIKALPGLSVPAAAISAGGALAGDRRYAAMTPDGAFVNAKRTGAVCRIRAAFDPGDAPGAGTVLLGWAGSAGDAPPGEDPEAWEDRTRFALPLDDAPGEADLDGISRWLSDHLEMPVVVRQDPARGYPDDTERSGPTVVSTRTLERVAQGLGLELPDVRRRFRANLELDAPAPFWEDGLCRLGRPVPFEVGAVTMHGLKPCQRCVVPTRDPATGERDRTFTARLMALRRDHLPPWADPALYGTWYMLAVNTRIPPGQTGRAVRVGDPVRIAPEGS